MRPNREMHRFVATVLGAVTIALVMTPIQASAQAEPEGAILTQALTANAPEQGGRIALNSVDDFNSVGGFAVVEAGTPAEEVVYYGGLDTAASELVDVIRDEPQVHPAGSFVFAGLDVCAVPAFCDDIGAEVDAWGTIDGAESALHGDCDAHAYGVYKNGVFINGDGGYSCDAKQHASTNIKVCIQIKKGGGWHKLAPCAANTAVQDDSVTAHVEAGCVEGRHWYRVWAHGEAVNTDGLVVHTDTDRGLRESITCQTATLLP